MNFHFVQMADPQFGMFASISEYTDDDIEERHARGLLVRKAPRPITGFADETRLYTAAIEATNRLNPAFAVVCGDLVHDAANQSQIDELVRITSKRWTSGIPMRLVSGQSRCRRGPYTRFTRPVPAALRTGQLLLRPRRLPLRRHQQLGGVRSRQRSRMSGTASSSS